VIDVSQLQPAPRPADVDAPPSTITGAGGRGPGSQPRRRQVRTELEDELVARARTDRAAFGTLYELHHGAVLAFVRRRIHHSSDAEDVAHEVFVKALGAIDRYEIRGWPFHAWLYQIAANAIADHHRRGQRHGGGLDEVSEGMLAGGGSSPDEVAADVDAVRRVWAAAASLPPHQRTALLLQVAADLPSTSRSCGLDLRSTTTRSTPPSGTPASMTSTAVTPAWGIG
jgi:RNA polymerase sigma factor (sigma-70 family)